MIDVKLLGFKNSGQKGVFEGVLTYVAMILISIAQILWEALLFSEVYGQI